MLAGKTSLVTAISLTTLAGICATSAAGTSSANIGGSQQLTAIERPRGVLADCRKGSGVPQGSLEREFQSRWNLILGPLAMRGAAVKPGGYSDSFRGNKFQLYVKAGQRVTLEVLPGARAKHAGLAYRAVPHGRIPHDGYRVITFVACKRGEFSPGLGGPAGRVSFWAGGVVAPAPMCVPVRAWTDDSRSPKRAVIHLGVADCG